MVKLLMTTRSSLPPLTISSEMPEYPRVTPSRRPSGGGWMTQFASAMFWNPPSPSAPSLNALVRLARTQLVTATFRQGRLNVLLSTIESSPESMKQSLMATSSQASMSKPSLLAATCDDTLTPRTRTR